MTNPIMSSEWAFDELQPVNLGRWVVGDGSDETAGFNAAAEEARSSRRGMFMPESLEVHIDGVVNLRYIVNLELQGVIKVGTGGRVDIGGSSFHRVGMKLRVRRIQHASSGQVNPVLRTIGVKQAHITVDYCDYWEWVADAGNTDDASISYVSAYPGKIGKLVFVTRDSESAVGWITEVGFYGGDIRYIETDCDSYRLNQISFYKPCLEGGEVHITHGDRWRFVDARCEYGTKFWFGAATSRIVIEDNFSGSPHSLGPGAVVVEDLGMENVVKSSYEDSYSRRSLALVDTSTAIFDASAEIAVKSLIPGRKLRAEGTWLDILDTGRIPVRPPLEMNEVSSAGWRLTRLIMHCDEKAFRPRVYLYDDAGDQIMDSEAAIFGQGARWDAPTGVVTYSSNQSFMQVGLTPSVAFVRMVLSSGNAVTAFSRLEILGFFTGASSDYPARIVSRNLDSRVRQDTAPTRGLPSMGTIVPATSGEWVLTKKSETKTTASAAAGSKVITVSSGSLTAIGDVIGVQVAGGATEWFTIAGINVHQITLSEALSKESPLGSIVDFGRWSKVSV